MNTRTFPVLTRRVGIVVTVLLAATAGLAACSSSGTHTATPAKSASATSTAPSSAAPGFHLPVTHPTVWLCRPGMANNPCLSGPLDATVITPDGTPTVQPFTPAKNPKIDCFYVYPTLSEAKTVAAPLAPEPAAVAVTKSQVARFQSVCRLFVPVYRQLTLAGLQKSITSRQVPTAVMAQAQADVLSAWHDYLDHDNTGRGVVLLGHSQGAIDLIALMKREVDRSPQERARLVSAIVLGGNLLVPQGKDVGGDLQNIPACRSKTQHGCVVAYSMFGSPPSAGAYFGRAATAIGRSGTPASQQVLCVNPAALVAGRQNRTTPLLPYFPTQSVGGSHLVGQSASSLPDYHTGFVELPGQFTGTCVSANGASWLQITQSRQTGVGMLVFDAASKLGPDWGLHLLDFNADQGDLVNLVQAQADSWR